MELHDIRRMHLNPRFVSFLNIVSAHLQQRRPMVHSKLTEKKSLIPKARLGKFQKFVNAVWDVEYEFTDCVIGCVSLLKENKLDWEKLYDKYKLAVIKSLDDCNDISRLYLLIEIDLQQNDSVTAIPDRALHGYKLTQPQAISEMVANLKNVLPEADPIYLDLIGEYYYMNEPELGEFIENAISRESSYPKILKYNTLVKEMKIIKRLTIGFNVEDFLRICPDPANYLKAKNCEPYIDEAVLYLKAKIGEVFHNLIEIHLYYKDYNLSDVMETFSKTNMITGDLNHTAGKRILFDIYTNQNKSSVVELFKEIAFIEHQEEILEHMENQKVLRQITLENAKTNGNINTCDNCFSDEILDSEVFKCPADHKICLPCVKNGIEVAFGENKIEFPCFGGCGNEFNDQLISEVVDSTMYTRIMNKRQTRDIKAAGIEGLETCAFCNYSVILTPDIKVVNCLNPECLKETCRGCREKSHAPNPCFIESNTEIKSRTTIENKMTDVLIRTCGACQNKFVKEGGCNHIHCACGAQICYICRKQLHPDENHFFSRSEESSSELKCPLYSEDEFVHEKAVETTAILIHNEIKEKDPESVQNFNIDKLLPKKRELSVSTVDDMTPAQTNDILARMTGQKAKDIANLEKPAEPKAKKMRKKR